MKIMMMSVFNINDDDNNVDNVFLLRLVRSAIISLRQEIIYLVDVVWWNLFNSEFYSKL